MPFTLAPCYNIAPHAMQPVIRSAKGTGNREAAMMLGPAAVFREGCEAQLQHCQRKV